MQLFWLFLSCIVIFTNLYVFKITIMYYFNSQDCFYAMHQGIGSYPR